MLLNGESILSGVMRHMDQSGIRYLVSGIRVGGLAIAITISRAAIREVTE